MDNKFVVDSVLMNSARDRISVSDSKKIDRTNATTMLLTQAREPMTFFGLIAKGDETKAQKV